MKKIAPIRIVCLLFVSVYIIVNKQEVYSTPTDPAAMQSFESAFSSAHGIVGATISDEENQLKTVEATVGAQANPSGNFLDVYSGITYSKRQAESTPEKVHLMYVFGNNSKANLFFQGSNAIRKYSRSVQEQINQWTYRNEGQIINIGEQKALFDHIQSGLDIKDLFHEKRHSLFLRSEYDMALHGPADGLSQLNKGDVLLLHLFNTDVYITVRISDLQPGSQGYMKLEIKRSDKKVNDGVVPTLAAHAGEWEVGKTYADSVYWSEYTVGNMPLVISVPHGGNMNPIAIPDRDCPNAVKGTDRYTVELAREIQRVFYEKYNMRPHVIVSNLSRRKVDHNRSIRSGACGNETAEAAWHQYHQYIDTALALAGKEGKRVFFVDIHAHGHKNQRLEVGYLINSAGLKEVYQEKNLDAHAEKSSVVNLLPLDKNTRGLALKELLMGERAFGTKMENEGIRAIPSRQDPYPKNDEVYLSRGYNTQHFTSTAYPNVYGLQLECNLTGVRDKANRPVFAEKFAKITLQYMELYKN